jgi:starch synthase
MPSMCEPCGLAQLIAMKYGTVPIVRAAVRAGGHVTDRDHARDSLERRTGYVFERSDHHAIESAISRAIVERMSSAVWLVEVKPLARGA